MQAWVEVPVGCGWGPVRILRGRLEDNGYHTEEYRLARGVMIQVTGSKPSAIVAVTDVLLPLAAPPHRRDGGWSALGPALGKESWLSPMRARSRPKQDAL
jgi:hypothetical protein